MSDRVVVTLTLCPDSLPAERGDLAILSADGHVWAQHEWAPVDVTSNWVGLFTGSASPGSPAEIQVYGPLADVGQHSTLMEARGA